MPLPFNDEAQARFDQGLEAILRRYPPDQKAAAMLPALRLCQDLAGHLSPAALQLVAGRLGVPPARAQEVATFYSLFFVEPKGAHLVDVCTNLSCSLCGAESALAHLEAKLKIRAGQTTPDRRITLREVECLASCGTGPVMQVDGEYVENLTAASIDAVLAGLK